MILVSWCPWMLRTESVRYSNTMAASALRELTGFRELLLEMSPKSVFREPKMLRKRKITWIVVFQKLRGMPQSGLTKYLASGKVQEEIKTPTLRKQDSRSNWAVL